MNPKDNQSPESESEDQGPRDGYTGEDQPIPRASDDEVLNETARLAREGRRELEADDREPDIRPSSDEDMPSR